MSKLLEVTEANLSKLKHRDRVEFALWCAKRVIHLVDDVNVAKTKACFAVTEAWLCGKATADECREVVDECLEVTYECWGAVDVARTVAYSANAAYSAAYAAYAAAQANPSETEIQQAYLYELVNADKIAEKALLGI